MAADLVSVGVGIAAILWVAGLSAAGLGHGCARSDHTGRAQQPHRFLSASLPGAGQLQPPMPALIWICCCGAWWGKPRGGELFPGRIEIRFLPCRGPHLPLALGVGSGGVGRAPVGAVLPTVVLAGPRAEQEPHLPPVALSFFDQTGGWCRQRFPALVTDQCFHPLTHSRHLSQWLRRVHQGCQRSPVGFGPSFPCSPRTEPRYRPGWLCVERRRGGLGCAVAGCTRWLFGVAGLLRGLGHPYLKLTHRCSGGSRYLFHGGPVHRAVLHRSGQGLDRADHLG